MRWPTMQDYTPMQPVDWSSEMQFAALWALRHPSSSLTNLVSQGTTLPWTMEAVRQSVLTSQKLKEMKLRGCLCVDNTFWALIYSYDRAGIGLPVAQVAN